LPGNITFVQTAIATDRIPHNFKTINN